MIALRDQRHIRIADVEILDDDFDAGVDRLLNHVFHRLRLTMADNDAFHAESDRLFDLFALKGCVLLALKDVQIDAERLGLTRDAGLIGLEIVALR